MIEAQLGWRNCRRCQGLFSVNTGQDRIGADIRNGMTPGQGGCPILQNTPCLHATPDMRSATGQN